MPPLTGVDFAAKLEASLLHGLSDDVVAAGAADGDAARGEVDMDVSSWLMLADGVGHGADTAFAAHAVDPVGANVAHHVLFWRVRHDPKGNPAAW